jgi:hypothetical protein
MASSKSISKIDANINRYYQTILSGTILVIDPSSGSSSSMPGYAIYEHGILKDQGYIDVPIPNDIHVRLRYIMQCIQKQFPIVDILVIEDIPIRMGRFTSGVAVRNLHRSIGVFLAAVKCNTVIEITPASWRRYIDAAKYAKADWNDAIVMGYTVVDKARLKAGLDKHPSGKSIDKLLLQSGK